MRKRKHIIFILLIFVIAAAGMGGYFVHSHSAHAAVSNQEIVLEEGQELLYAKITSISGNEMDYEVLEAQTVHLEDLGNDRGRNVAAQGTSGGASSDAMPSGGGGVRSSNGEMQSGAGAPSGDRQTPNDGMPSDAGAPSGGGRTSNGGMPSGGGRTSNSEMPSGDQNGRTMDSAMPSEDQSKKASDDKSSDLQNMTVTTYTETGKTGQIQIPVGTDVETKLGTVTTFSRLSNGDTIRMLMQKADDGGEELLKIWIVE